MRQSNPDHQERNLKAVLQVQSLIANELQEDPVVCDRIRTLFREGNGVPKMAEIIQPEVRGGKDTVKVLQEALYILLREIFDPREYDELVSKHHAQAVHLFTKDECRKGALTSNRLHPRPGSTKDTLDQYRLGRSWPAHVTKCLLSLTEIPGYRDTRGRVNLQMVATKLTAAFPDEEPFSVQHCNTKLTKMRKKQGLPDARKTRSTRLHGADAMDNA